MTFFAASALRASLVAAVVSLVAAAPVQAQQAATPSSLTQIDASSFRLRLANAGQERTRIEVVQASNGQSLFSETTTAPAYGHRFNFNSLSAGSYAVVVRIGKATQQYNVLVSNANGLVCRLVSPAVADTPALAAN